MTKFFQAVSSQRWGIASTGLVAVYIFTLLWVYWWDADPVVLADELLFARGALENQIFGNQYSNYFFNLIYGFSNLGGEQWLSYARVLGALLWILFTFISYKVLRNFGNDLFSAAGALFVGLSAISTFAFTFLPEVLSYVLILATATLLALFWTHESRWLLMGAGLLGGLALLTKPHALASLLVFGVVFLVISLARATKSLQAIGNIAIFLGMAALVRFAVGFAIDGLPGLDPLGNYATGPSSSETFSAGPASGGIGNIPASAFFREFAMDYLFVISIILYFSIRPTYLAIKAIRDRRAGAREFIQISLVLIAVGLTVASWLFSAIITTLGDNHEGRILMRYFEFTVPIIVFVWALNIFESKRTPKITITFVELALLSFGIFYIASGQINEVFFQPSDSLFLLSLIDGQSVVLLFLIFLVFVTVSTQFSVAARYLALPLVLILTSSSVGLAGSLGTYYSEESVFGPAGRAVQGVIKNDDALFVGIDRTRVSTLVMTSNRITEEFQTIKPFSQVDFGSADYLVVQGELYPNGPAKPVYQESGVAVFEKVPDFNELGGVFDYVSKVDIGVITSWGFWAASESLQVARPTTNAGEVLVRLVRHPSTTETKVEVILEGTGEALTLDLEKAGEIYNVRLVLEDGVGALTFKYEGQQIEITSGLQDTFGLGIAEFVEER